MSADDYADCGHPLPDYPVTSEATEKTYCCRYCLEWFEPEQRA